MITTRRRAVEILEDYANYYSEADVDQLAGVLDQIRAEAIKEFAEKLKDIVDEPALIRGRVIDTIIARIDNLVKETTEK